MNNIVTKKKMRLSSVQILTLGFLIVILFGGILLSLPISSVKGEFTNLLDCLFTATSAVGVNGLVVIDTGTHWSFFGQIIILLLIEIGGLGFMSFATFIVSFFGKRITLRDRLVMQESMNTFDIQGIVKMVRYVIGFTFLIEGLGAAVLSVRFIPMYGLGKGIYYSIFHSISAFCNAGFDLFGGYSSLTSFSHDPLVIITIIMLFMIGGIGFTVWIELYNYSYNKKKYRKLSTNTKLVVLVTIILLVIGTLFILVGEYNNPKTIGGYSLFDKIMNAFLSSASPRTAGFNSVSTADMTNGSKLSTILLMYIGGSPGSTAGGIKTTTFGIIILTVISVIKGREDVEVFERKIPKDLVYKAFSLSIIGLALVFIVSTILSYTQPSEKYIDVLYEATSAFGTAGLTTGVTQRLGTISKIVVMITMYLGRVGPITVVLAFMNNKKKRVYKYPETKILIG